jgi:putative intracellular protease/amidase
MTTTTKTVLMILTSHDRMGDTDTKTGFWLEELAAPYYELKSAGFAIDLASPKGGRPPADPKSEKADKPDVRRFVDDREAQEKLTSTQKLSDVLLSDDDATKTYDAYFVVGGHGVMFDLATDESSSRLLGRAWDNGKIVAAVCHGPAALVSVKDKAGHPIVAGRNVTGFSNEEEEVAGLTKLMPFPLESRLRDLNGTYTRGPNWSSFTTRDGNLITGQNPASSAAVAKLVIEALK